MYPLFAASGSLLKNNKLTGIPLYNGYVGRFIKSERMDRVMNKSFLAFIGGICTGVFLIMLYLHRALIKAAITGGELPETPESCPAFNLEDDEK